MIFKDQTIVNNSFIFRLSLVYIGDLESMIFKDQIQIDNSFVFSLSMSLPLVSLSSSSLRIWLRVITPLFLV